jgi:DNA-directed DNA polymerase III PolC
MIHLHAHSIYSLLHGTASPEQLVERAVACGMSAIALTDVDGMYGAIPFYQSALEAGIRPILGVQLERAVVLARNRAGYGRLCRMITALHLHRDPPEEMAEDEPAPIAGLPSGTRKRWGVAEGPFELADYLHDEDVFVLSSDRALLERLAAAGFHPLAAVTLYKGDAASRYYAGQLRDWARARGLRAVACSPVHFIEPEHYHVHRVLSAIRLNTTLGHLSEDQTAPPEAWFRTREEMEALYDEWPDLLRNTEWVAERCCVELELDRPMFPQCPVPKEESPFSYLWKLAFEGIRRRYRPMTPDAARRLQYELEVINELGFAPYFLIVTDIVRHARERDIPILGRGSAANSIVAYALGISRVDPLRYNLYFERFLNLSRSDCPDIDLDVCWRRRDEVIDYIYEQYGTDRVAMICTFNTFKARAAVRETGKAHGMTESEIGAVAKRLPHYSARDIRKVVRFLPECKGLPVDEEPLKSIIDVAEFIDGFPRHISLHPCGLVIAPEPLTEYTPLQRAAKGMLVSQYDMHPIERLGLVKMDVIGHRSLTVLDDAVHAIHERRGISIDLEDLPEPDPLAARLIGDGRTIGCFQIESPAMRALLQHTRSDNTDMLIKTLSLVRPGPSGSGMKQHFIDRRLGREAAEYLHPAMEEVLADTYGVMLYQEDILKVANAVAGMSLAEGDALRRAMTKRRSPREMAKNMQLFMTRAAEKGVDQSAAEQIWELIANFSKYSYCKAHACTYGEISYQCVYLKAHFPAEFMASVLSNRGGFYHSAVYIEEARRMGADVLPPDVNRSEYAYTVENGAVRTGFVEVRELTRQSVRALLECRRQRPFDSLLDFCRRTGMAYADVETLIASGACDSLGRNRAALRWELKLIMQHREKDAAWDGGQGQLLEGAVPQEMVPRLPDISARRRLNEQWGSLGLLASTHPFECHLHLLLGRELILSSDLKAYAGRAVTLAGWLIAERRVALKERGAMKFVTFEDPAGVFEAVLFPEAYQRFGALFDSHGPYFVTGKVQQEDAYCSIIVSEVERAADCAKTPGSSQVTPPMSWFRDAGAVRE